ncbi:MAG TPA: heterodisulfide reductase-related iron-sulfur binding cluster [Planctomycetota bacterium]|nr:heterodisulfide reductase-related iron-sulfur binding cluster [Planctomycetota bacterium]
MDAKTLVDYAGTLDCIHCGLCLRTCPTYQLTGRESSSPRGRIHLMRGVAEARLDPRAPAYEEELDFCLVCRHCESVCPAGVRFGEMMEHSRDALGHAVRRPPLERLARWIGFRALLPRRWALRLAFSALRLAQRSGTLRLAVSLLGERGRALASLPRVPPRSERRPLPDRTPAQGERRGRAAVLEGCAMAELYPRVNRASVEALAAIGIETVAPADHACCGALHAHNGDLEGARALARATLRAFDELVDEAGRPLPVVVNSAGCSAHMKSYGRLLAADTELAERAAAFSERTRDFTEFVAEHAPDSFQPRLAPGALPGPVAYDDPCHLCHGQQIRSQPRTLLDRVDGLQRVELEDSESCCGSAGIYSLLRPRDSQAIFAAKLRALEASGAAVVVTANPGCQLQWESGLARAGSPVRVLHLAEVLALGLQADPPSAPRSQ